MEAIILAGGFGTRLKSVISDIPKAMAPIGDKPFLSYLLDYLKSQGVTKIILSVHHLREHIRDYFKSQYNDLEICYAEEEQPLGTGGAIVNALKYGNVKDDIFVINGDTFLKLNYQALRQQHLVNASRMTIALRKISDCSRYGTVEINKNRIIAFKSNSDKLSGYINAGVYLIHPEIFAGENLAEKFSFEEFIQKNLQVISPEGFITEDYFIDIGIPEDYRQAATMMG